MASGNKTAASKKQYNESTRGRAKRQLHDLRNRTESFARSMIAGNFQLGPAYVPKIIVDNDQAGEWPRWVGKQKALVNRAREARNGDDERKMKARNTTAKEFPKIVNEFGLGESREGGSVGNAQTRKRKSAPTKMPSTKTENDNEDGLVEDEPASKRKRRLSGEDKADDADSSTDQMIPEQQQGTTTAKPQELRKASKEKPKNLLHDISQTTRKITEGAIATAEEEMRFSRDIVAMMSRGGLELWRRMTNEQRQTFSQIHLIRYSSFDFGSNLAADALYRELKASFEELQGIHQVDRGFAVTGCVEADGDAVLIVEIDYLTKELLRYSQQKHQGDRNTDSQSSAEAERIVNACRAAELALGTNLSFVKKGILVALVLTIDPTCSLSTVTNHWLIDLIDAVRGTESQVARTSIFKAKTNTIESVRALRQQPRTSS